MHLQGGFFCYKNPMTQGIYLAAIGMTLAVALSNYLVELPINEWLTWGAFSYPITFLITELTNYYYGSFWARRVVYIGFTVAVSLSFMSLLWDGKTPSPLGEHFSMCFS